MNVVTWTPFALRCLDEIHSYIIKESGAVSIADRFLEKVFDRTKQLGFFPESGVEESVLVRKGIYARYIVEGNYKIIYQYIEEKQIIVILDIFHTKQNPPKILNR